MDRGVIYNRDRATQVRDFSGLRFGKITPTDIDGLIDFGDKCFVIIETKFGDTELPYGQRLAIERVIDKLPLSLAIIASHDKSAQEDIDVADCTVTEFRTQRSWKKIKKYNVKKLIDLFLIKNKMDSYLVKDNIEPSRCRDTNCHGAMTMMTSAETDKMLKEINILET